MLSLVTIPEELVHRICSELCLADNSELRASCKYLRKVISDTPVMKDLRVQGWDRFERMREIYPRVSVALVLGSEDYVENVDALMAKHACYINGLDLYNSRLDEVSNFVNLLRGIQSLDISFNNVQSFPNWLCHLHTLRIGSNPLRSLDAICRLTSLRLLDLSYLTRPADVLTEAQTGPLSNLKLLATLSLAGNALQMIPSFVSSLPHLSTLYLQDNNLTSLLPLTSLPIQAHTHTPTKSRTYSAYSVDKSMRLVGAQSQPHLESTATYIPTHAARSHVEALDTDVREITRDIHTSNTHKTTSEKHSTTPNSSNEQSTAKQQPLRGLRKLNVNSNKITALPADMSEYHPHLHTLLASDNRLETLDSLVQLRELRELDVSSNWLTYRRREQSVKESEVVYRTVLNDCAHGECAGDKCNSPCEYSCPNTAGENALGGGSNESTPTYTQAWSCAKNRSQLRVNELRVFQMLNGLQELDVRYNQTDIEKWMEWQTTKLQEMAQLSVASGGSAHSQSHSNNVGCTAGAEIGCSHCCCCDEACASNHKHKTERKTLKKRYGAVERVWYAETHPSHDSSSSDSDSVANSNIDSHSLEPAGVANHAA